MNIHRFNKNTDIPTMQNTRVYKAYIENKCHNTVIGNQTATSWQIHNFNQIKIFI